MAAGEQFVVDRLIEAASQLSKLSTSQEKKPNENNKMKLNIKWPKKQSYASWFMWAAVLIQLAHISLALLVQRQQVTNSNEISPTTATLNKVRYSRDVTNLRSTPDFRSVKLRWTYEHTDANRPESFHIRYCELTSWMAEIKCRHREMQVQQQQTAMANDSTVIKLQHLRNEPQVFETQIYDLRALTNYTFHVNVLRFMGDENSKVGLGVDQQQRRPARRLELLTAANELDTSQAVSKVESTKAFSAEAVKCLANSSEVQVNTGRYFGGRISVEGQMDSSGRCQVVGNKTSEQSIYTLTIDHQACHSRILDGNRIETMILVHENRDILTHNTARFLVQCNIGQKSFTVKASISLPKVMSGGGGGSSAFARPATISSLSGKPATNSLAQSSRADHDVQLGSMPGIYRLIRADQPTGAAHKPPQDAGEAVNLSVRRESKQLKSEMQMSSLAQQQQQQQQPPRPVDVSSSILFVEHREPRAMQIAITTTTAKPQLVDALLEPINRPTGESDATAATAANAPIIMTNNHRIAGDDMQMKLLGKLENKDFTIKYSANKVDEFAIASASPSPMSQVARSRSGRMRQIGGTQAASSEQQVTPTPISNLESRMGDAVAPPGGAPISDLMLTEASNRNEVKILPTGSTNNTTTTTTPTLAHNITGALLRWSLRTLGNLARKSLESLELDEAATSSTQPEDEQLDGFLVSQRSNEASPKPLLTSTRAPVIRTTRAPPTTQRAWAPVGDQARQARQQAEAPTLKAAPAQAAKQRNLLTEPEVERREDSKPAGSSPLWPLWALLLGLACLIMAALYFLFAPTRSLRFSSSMAAPAPAPAYPEARHRKSVSGDLLAQLSQFSAPTCAESPAAAAATPSRRKATPPSPIGSATTRSTSAASTSSSSRSSGENYCKTNEQFVLYTDYLLLADDNVASSLAHQETSRRPSGESFA